MPKKIGDKQFHVMCEIWGVDQAIEDVWEMGMSVTNEQIETERKNEAEHSKRWNDIFKSIIKED